MQKQKKLTTFLGLLFLITHGATNAAERPMVKSLLEMRHSNVVLQEWDLSCGAAALTTLLRYQHEMDITEKEVALAMINRDEYIANPQLLKLRQGFSLLDLKLFTDSTGLIGNGFGDLDFDDLLTMAPVLVPVNLEGYNHFVVFRGIAGNRVLIADPAWGNRTLPKEEFLHAWFPIDRLGRVGFTAKALQQETQISVNGLAPRFMDFVMIQ